MVTFHVNSTFYLAERKLFVLTGAVAEGSICTGMLVRVPFNPSSTMVEPIYAVETASTDHGRQVCLCFRVEPSEVETWQVLDIRDEILEVTGPS